MLKEKKRKILVSGIELQSQLWASCIVFIINKFGFQVSRIFFTTFRISTYLLPKGYILENSPIYSAGLVLLYSHFSYRSSLLRYSSLTDLALKRYRKVLDLVIQGSAAYRHAFIVLFSSVLLFILLLKISNVRIKSNDLRNSVLAFLFLCCLMYQVPRLTFSNVLIL